MNEQTEVLLTKLAVKMGTTVDHLWGVLVRQAPISSTADLLTIIACVVYANFCIQYFRKYAVDEDGISIPGIVFLATGCFASLVVFVGVVNLPTIISGFCNPEFWALKQLLK